MRLLAIDPGSTGGLALYDDKQLTLYKKLPNIALLANINKFYRELCNWQIDIVIVEEQIGRSGSKGIRNGPRSIFGHGVNYGRLIALLHLSNLEPILIHPTCWMNKVPIIEIPLSLRDAQNKPIKDSKVRNISWALSMGVEVCGPKGGWQDGLADAVCLGWAYTQGMLDVKYYPKEWAA